jgi:hypothetical protein
MSSALEFKAETLKFSAGASSGVVSRSSTAASGGGVDLVGAGASVSGRILLGADPGDQTDVIQKLESLRTDIAVADNSISDQNSFSSSDLPIAKLDPTKPPLPPRLGGTGLATAPAAPPGALAYLASSGSAFEFDPRLAYDPATAGRLTVQGSVVADGVTVQASNNYLGIPCVFAGGVNLMDPATSARPAITQASAVGGGGGQLSVEVAAQVATSSFVTLDRVSVTELGDANAFPGRVLEGFESVQHAFSNANSDSGTYSFDIAPPLPGSKVYVVVSDSAGNTSEVREVTIP